MFCTLVSLTFLPNPPTYTFDYIDRVVITQAPPSKCYDSFVMLPVAMNCKNIT